MDTKTLEDSVGNTPLVRLKRIPGAVNDASGNVILAKLEGNNPAGSVKDRPALSMILRAEQRGRIKPGDTLIEATSGNTGIALAMVAAMRGYRMVLIMPENQSIERRQSMRAFGAELVLTPKSGGMETARDLAERMVAEGKGVMLDQFANPDNPIAHYEGTGHRDDHGRVAFPQGKEPGGQHRRVPARRGLADRGHPQVAGSLPAENLRQGSRRPARICRPGRG